MQFNTFFLLLLKNPFLLYQLCRLGWIKDKATAKVEHQRSHLKRNWLTTCFAFSNSCTPLKCVGKREHWGEKNNIYIFFTFDKIVSLFLCLFQRRAESAQAVFTQAGDAAWNLPQHCRWGLCNTRMHTNKHAARVRDVKCERRVNWWHSDG